MEQTILSKAVMNLIYRIKCSSHLMPLLDHETLSVTFSTRTENTITLFISKTDISIGEKPDLPTITIRGNCSDILQLIEGQTRLQALQKRKDIVVEGKFRAILKVESLLYCCSCEPLKTRLEKNKKIV